MKKKAIKILISLLILLVIGLFVSNMSGGWIYVKFDGKLYVANTNGSKECPIEEQIGCVESKVPNIIKPLANAQSNGFPKGTELYKMNESTNIIARFGDKYYVLQDIDRAEGWGNGIKIKIKNGSVIY